MIPLPDIKISTHGETSKNNNHENEDDVNNVSETDQLLLDESHLSVPKTYPSESVGRGKSYLSPSLLNSPELKRFISSPLIQFNNPKGHRHAGSDSDEMELLTSDESSANEADSDDEPEVNAIFKHQQQRQPQNHIQHQQPQHPQQTQQCTQQDLLTRRIRRNNTVRENRYSLAAAAENFTLASLETEHRISAMKKKEEPKALQLAKSCIRKIVGKDKVLIFFFLRF